MHGFDQLINTVLKWDFRLHICATYWRLDFDKAIRCNSAGSLSDILIFTLLCFRILSCRFPISPDPVLHPSINFPIIRIDMSKKLALFIKEMMPDISEVQLGKLVLDLPVVEYPRNERLVRQGEAAEDCYFVLKGCLRMYYVDEEGNEHTVDFFTELQSLTIFESYKEGKPSPYSVECVEGCLLLEGDLQNEEEMNKKYPFLQNIVRSALESNLSSGQMDMALFRASNPEQRYLQLLEKRPGLAGRVAQHQLASYLGITPESLSRLKKRLYDRKTLQ